ncbi:CoA transferase [Sporichthya brevicatena]|uniref:CaiB/BaiF CoA transferase family protein n=1 Tax=Sporichthya brevicatena TaxID=171442 RepID=UPI0031DEE8E5
MLPLLAGIRVVDLTKLYSLTTSRLADLGADVIKVEAPPAGDYLRGLPPFVGNAGSMAYLTLNRNKRSIGLDLRTDAGREVLHKLVATADVVVENSPPNAQVKLGLDYPTLRQIKPDLVYCSVTAYGQDGPYAPLPSHSMNVDAAAGEIRIMRGPTGRPEITAYSTVGHSMELGGLEAATAITAALVQRGRTGQGQYLDVAGWDAGLASNQRFLAALNLGSADAAIGASTTGGMGARSNVYGTRDDQVLLIFPVEKHLWQRFCAVVERPEWAERGTWSQTMDFGDTDAEADEALRADIETVMRTRTLAEWMEAFLAAGVPAAPVSDPDQLPTHPHVHARHMVVTAGDVHYVRPPVRLPESEFAITIAPPAFGAHTHDVLDGLGFDENARAGLIAAGAVFAADDGSQP